MVDPRPLFHSTQMSIHAGQHIRAMHFEVHDRGRVLLAYLGDSLVRGDKCFTAIQEADAGISS